MQREGKGFLCREKFKTQCDTLFMTEIYSEWVRQLVHHCDAEVFCQGVEKKMTFSTLDENVSTFLLLANCFIRP